MNSWNDPLDVLKQARELLLERMREAILEQADEILADAAGESFLSEIETLYDQMGNKLVHLNQMISQLPPQAPESEFPEEDSSPAPPDLPRLPQPMFLPLSDHEELRPSETVEAIGLPAPGVPMPQAPAFRRYVSLIEAERITEAGELIGQLLGLTDRVGYRCAEYFSKRYREDQRIVVRAMQIRHELSRQQFNEALVLLHECFGLRGIEAMVALHRMRDLMATPH